MKNYIATILFVLTSVVNAQEAPEMPKYNAKNAANIFYYNISEVPEKIKVKNESTESKTIKALRNYNDKIKKIAFLNSTKLQELDLIVNSAGKRLFSDRDLAQRVRKKIEELILPLRDSVLGYEKVLNDTLKTFLSRKQHKKWLKYQRAEKRKLIPERPNNNRAAAPSNINRRNRGGMGMRGRRF